MSLTFLNVLADARGSHLLSAAEREGSDMGEEGASPRGVGMGPRCATIAC